MSLPILSLELGRGHRFDDCANYDGCLSRFAKLHPNGDARCPVGCSFYDPEPSHVRLARAHAYGVRPAPSTL
jgi:hypothetical protein